MYRYRSINLKIEIGFFRSEQKPNGKNIKYDKISAKQDDKETYENEKDDYLAKNTYPENDDPKEGIAKNAVIDITEEIQIDNSNRNI